MIGGIVGLGLVLVSVLTPKNSSGGGGVNLGPPPPYAGIYVTDANGHDYHTFGVMQNAVNYAQAQANALNINYLIYNNQALVQTITPQSTGGTPYTNLYYYVLNAQNSTVFQTSSGTSQDAGLATSYVQTNFITRGISGWKIILVQRINATGQNQIVQVASG